MSSTQPEISLRPFAKEDEPLVRELAQEAGSEEQEVDRFLAQDQILVAVDVDRQVLGFIAYSLSRHQLAISELGVVEDQRQQGIDTRLLKEAKAIAEDKNLSKISVETSNDNIPALKLYQQFGFHIAQVEVGQLLAHHGEEEAGWQGIPVRDLIRLELEL